LKNTAVLNEKLRDEVKKFYSATPSEIRQGYEKRTALGTKKVWDEDSKKTWEERNCTYCEEKHVNICKTHNTDKCRQKGFDKERAAKLAGATKRLSENKEDDAYFDSCAAEHFSKEVPDRLDKSQQGLIETAQAQQLQF
jgi:hypothetical protein